MFSTHRASTFYLILVLFGLSFYSLIKLSLVHYFTFNNESYKTLNRLMVYKTLFCIVLSTPERLKVRIATILSIWLSKCSNY